MNTLQENLHYPSPEQVMFLFKGRCPACYGSAVTVHELEPRARGQYTLRMQNRTAICRDCHDDFHKHGASEHNIAVWKVIISEYLKSIGNWDLYNNWGNYE